MTKLLKLDLQMFAEGDGAVETPMPSFAEMYEQGAPEPEGDTGADDMQDVTDPQDDVIDDDDTVNNGSGDVLGGDTDPADGGNNQQQQKPWKNEQNAQFAAERRRQEEQQRIAQAVQAARDELYAQQFAGKVNPYTGQPIRNEADYKAYMQAYNADVLKNAGIQQEQFDQIVNSDPRIIQAQQIVQQQEAIKQQNAKMQQQQQLNDAVAKIRKFDKSVKTEQDIINNPHFGEIAAMYNRGYSLEDAYYLANRAELEQKKQAAARQQAVNQVTSKSHMKATGQNGAGDEIVVPSDVMAAYRRMNPKWTEADIKKHYAKMNKKG